MPTEVFLPASISPEMKPPRRWRKIWGCRNSQVSEHENFTNIGVAQSSNSGQPPGSGQRQITGAALEQFAPHKSQTAEEKVCKTREERRARAEEEKARKKFIGGVTWGFDPTAGIRRTQHQGHNNTSCVTYTAPGQNDAGGQHDSDETERLTGERQIKTGKFGIEYGGPGKEGKYGHGSLQTRLQPNSLSVARRS